MSIRRTADADDFAGILLAVFLHKTVCDQSDVGPAFAERLPAPADNEMTTDKESDSDSMVGCSHPWRVQSFLKILGFQPEAGKDKLCAGSSEGGLRRPSARIHGMPPIALKRPQKVDSEWKDYASGESRGSSSYRSFPTNLSERITIMSEAKCLVTTRSD